MKSRCPALLVLVALLLASAAVQAQDGSGTDDKSRAPQAMAAPYADATKVCSRMGKPRLPELTWSGSVAYRAHATVKNGRVVSVNITKQSGATSREVQRALVQSIVQALRESYECPGDHVFEQDFSFASGR